MGELESPCDLEYSDSETPVQLVTRPKHIAKDIEVPVKPTD